MFATSFFTSLGNSLLNLNGWHAYLLVGAFCFGEIALFIGFVLPGEIAVVYGGVLASRHKVDLTTMLLLVNFCSIAGNLVGYEVGRHLGPRLLRHRPLRDRPAVERCRQLLHRRGAVAVFIGRFVAVVRAFVPAVAGMSDVNYRQYVVASAASGVIWATGYCLAGFAAGLSYAKVISVAGRTTAIVLGVLVVVGIVAFFVRRHLRHGQTSEEEVADLVAGKS